MGPQPLPTLAQFECNRAMFRQPGRLKAPLRVGLPRDRTMGRARGTRHDRNLKLAHTHCRTHSVCACTALDPTDVSGTIIG
jgi:hypothetical protein